MRITCLKVLDRFRFGCGMCGTCGTTGYIVVGTPGTMSRAKTFSLDSLIAKT